jgi:hypothetical protein
VVDHLVFLAVREEASPEEVEDLLSSIRALRDEVPSTVDLSVGKDFSGVPEDTPTLSSLGSTMLPVFGSTWSIQRTWP